MAELERKRRIQSLLQFLLGVALLVIVNVLANARFGDTALYGALDLTEEKRFTLTDNTVEQLEALTEPMLIRVLLAGDLPASYERLRSATEDILIDFAGQNSSIEFEFVNPLAGPGDEVQQRQQQMAQDGILPVTDFAQSAGNRSLKAIYPYALVYYGNRQRVVQLLESSLPNVSLAQRLNQAEALLEYNFSRTIDAITDNNKPLIALSTGNGELPPLSSADLFSELSKEYEVGPIDLDSFAFIPQDIRLLMILKPTEPFTDFEQFKLDQYVMNGGKVLWAVDAVAMDYDSLRTRNEYYPQVRDLGLNDLFFRYGVRLDPVLGLDLRNTRIPIVTSRGADGPEVQLVPFPYHVLAIPDADHPIVQNLDPVDLRFPSVIESVNDDPEIKKTVLLQSSDRARRQRLPSPIDLDMQKFQLDVDRFSENDLPFAMLLEGSFTSPYANRLSRENEAELRASELAFRPKSVETAMIIISDGDIAANSVQNGNTVLPLGLNRFEKFTYANKTFLMNAVAYLLDPDGVIGARGKQVKLRLMDTEEAQLRAGYWRFLNIILPLILLGLFGLTFFFIRRRRYAGRFPVSKADPQ